MNNSSAPVQDAVSNFSWKWFLSDLKKIPPNSLNAFSCFSCGGGSTMGYKLAGYNVLGCCEIDPQMFEIYKKNHKPKHSFLMDIRDFLKIPNNELSEELLDLDILDGSPPCSSFSLAGERDKGWNVEKTFREGQKQQRLDDLFFVFIELAKKLKPKIVVAENVKGLLVGKAKGYVHEIIKEFDNAGYDVQIFLLDSSKMGVPQKRERVFFICRRKDLHLPKVSLTFDEKPILFGQVRSEKGKPFKNRGKYYNLLQKRQPNDRSICDISMRVLGQYSGFNNKILSDSRVADTITSNGLFFRMIDGMFLSDKDFINCQTFPQDYDFCNASVQYVCGMSVPPVMMANIAKQIYLQIFKKE